MGFLRSATLAKAFGLFSLLWSLSLAQQLRRTTVREEATPSYRDLQQGPSVDQLIERFQISRAQYYEKLKVDYGEAYFEALFIASDKTSSVGKPLFTTGAKKSEVPWARVVRKVSIKILEYLRTGTPQSLVWATGGHSASAGHGNFFNESYTSVLNSNAALFDDVGLSFAARSYAMGGTSSGPEIASCAKEIFGLDVDIVAWDYGMCDGRNYATFELYAYRVGALPHRPAVLMLQPGGVPGRTAIVEQLAARGLAILKMDDTYMNAELHTAFPDCTEMEVDAIHALPDFVKSFRCGNAVEKGEPCSDAKWTLTGDEVCDNRRFRTGWHPGWKWHAYHGHVYTLFVLELVEEALQTIKQKGSDPSVLAATLKAEETEDFAQFLAEPEVSFPNVYTTSDFSVETLYKQPNYCHTARLPAEIRYQGYLNGKADATLEGFTKGVELVEAKQLVSPEEMPLTFDQTARQLCHLEVIIDYKDFFLVSASYDDYAKLVLPTESEVQAYGQGRAEPLRGVVAVCSAACGWHCPPDTLDLIAVVKDQAVLRVNGEAIGNLTDWQGGCSLLQRSGGSHVWPANAQGKYVLEAKVTEAGKVMRLSSVMIW